MITVSQLIRMIYVWALMTVVYSLLGSSTFQAVPIHQSLPSQEVPTPNQTVNAILGDVSYLERFGTQPPPQTDEVLRIQTHLEYVEQLLRKAHTEHLSPELQQQRQENIERLRVYRLQGVFPRNFDYPHERRPCFIDSEGRLCAVGYLIAESAGLKLAQKINSRYQYAYLSEMHMPEIETWLQQSGLTKREAAMIQPTYGFVEPHPTTPLTKAVVAGDESAVKLILLSGVNANVKDAEKQGGNTPLTWAIQGHNLKIVRLLLASGAMVDLQNNFGCTPFMLALRVRNLPIARELLASGADVNKKDKNGKTPLFYALENSSQDDGTDFVNLLLAAHAKVNVSDQGGSTPLHVAALSSSASSVKILLEKGALVNSLDRQGSTPLHKAASRGLVSSLKLLLNSGALVNHQDQYGNTPLIYTMIEGKNLEKIKVLLSAGANVNLKNKGGKTALSLLLGGLFSPNDLKIFETLLAAGADVNVKDTGYGQTPLMLAAQSRQDGFLEVIQKLIMAGAEVNATDHEGKTALIWAATDHSFYGPSRYEYVKALIAAGANINVLDKAGWEKILHYRQFDSDAEVVVMDETMQIELIRKKAIQEMDQEDEKIMKLLIEAGLGSNSKKK